MAGRRRPRSSPTRWCRSAHTPLGPLAGGLTLRRHRPPRPARRARLRDPAGAAATTAEPAGRRGTAGDWPPLLAPAPAGRTTRSRPTPTCCDHPALGEPVLRGYLAGRIDVVFAGRRRPATSSSTTRPTGSGGPTSRCTVAALPPSPAGRRRCCTSHYPLQALLYRWRCTGSCAGGCPGYDPARHLGGVLYLYVRGMCGPDTPSSTAHRAGSSRGSRPVALVDRAVRPAGRCRVTLRPRARRDPLRPAPRRWRPGCCATFNQAGVLDAADVHVATRLGTLAGEHDEQVLARGRARRARPAQGSVCVDLATVGRRRASTPACRGRELAWPTAVAAAAALAAAPAVLPLRRRVAAVPRPVLARGGAGLRRPGRSARRAPPTSGASGSTRHSTGSSRDRRLRGAAGRRAGPPAPRRPPSHRRPGHRQDHDRRPAARPAAAAGRAARCGSRSPRRPARRRPGCRGGRRGGRRTSRRRPRRGSATFPARRSHRLLGWRPGTPAGSGMTATTGCRTTSSSSTRPRWCR